MDDATEENAICSVTGFGIEPVEIPLASLENEHSRPLCFGLLTQKAGAKTVCLPQSDLCRAVPRRRRIRWEGRFASSIRSECYGGYSGGLFARSVRGCFAALAVTT